MNTKKNRLLKEKVDMSKVYSLDKAVEVLVQYASKNFIETVDVAINLGVDPKKSDHMIRGFSLLPNGTGNTKIVAVLAKEDRHKEAKEAGADIVGFEDLLEDIGKEKLNFDVLVTTPDVMPMLAKYGKILGPKGLMPNPKVGNVTSNISEVVGNLKKGQAIFRCDKYGIVHCAIGKINFMTNALKENLLALLVDIRKLKPSDSKGEYIKKITLSTTMGPGLEVDIKE